MQQREVGTTGLRVSVIGLGCSRFGSVGSGITDRQAVMLIDQAYDLGITLFDTASIYGQGDSERLLGKALQQKRDRVVLISKGGYQLSGAGGFITRYAKPVARRLAARSGLVRRSALRARSSLTRQNFDPRSVRQSLEGSLKRLRSEFLDLYLLHSLPPEELARDSLFEVLEGAKTRGMIRHYGFSMVQFPDGLASLLPDGVEVLGGPVNPSVTNELAQMEVLPRRVGVIGYQPFAGGSLSSSHGGLQATGARAREIAEQLGLTPAQVMVRFALQQTAVSTVVVGTSNPAHLLENVSGLDGQMAPGPIVW